MKRESWKDLFPSLYTVDSDKCCYGVRYANPDFIASFESYELFLQ